MKSGPKQRLTKARAIRITRALVATVLALSFFATIVPLGSASAGLMACCIGKPGHESGSCSTGLLKSSEVPESEVFFGQEPAPPAESSPEVAEVKIEEEEGGHCNLHTQPTSVTTSDTTASGSDATSTRPEKSRAEAASIETKELGSETPGQEAASIKTKESGSVRIHALSKPCPADCGTCSVAYTRQPRPREQSIPSFAARPRSPAVGRSSQSGHPQIMARDRKWSQLRPRAPPVCLA